MSASTTNHPQSIALGVALKQPLVQALWLLVFFSWLPILGATTLNPWTVVQGTGCFLLPTATGDLFADLGLPLPALSNLGALLVLGSLVAFALRDQALVLALALGVSIHLVPLITGCAARPSDPQASMAFWAAASGLGIALITSMGIFLIRGHIFGAGFASFLAMLFYETIGTGLLSNAGVGWRAPSLVGQLYTDFSPNPAILFGVFLTLLAARVVVKAYADNRAILMQLRVDGLLGKGIIKAFRLWLPMLAIFTVLTAGYSVMWHFADQGAADFMISQTEVPAPAEPIGLEATLVHIQTEQVRTWRAELETRSLATQTQVNQLVRNSAQETYDFVSDQLPIRAPGTQTKNCRWYDIGCHVMNLAKSIANSIYQGMREGALNKLKAKLDRAEAEAGRGNDAFRTRAVAEIDTMLVAYRERSIAGIGHTFAALRVLSTLLFLYTLLVLLKTYLIVLGRVVLHPSWGIVAKLEDGAVPPSHGDTRSSARGALTFGRNRRDILFLTRDTDVCNSPSSGRIPRPLTGFFSRIAHRAWRMQRIDLSNCSDTVSLDLPPPASLVEWTLRTDERVIFEFSHFVGMSDNTRIKPLLNFNLASLIFGRALVYYAEGPGTLLLRTNATAITTRTANGRTSIKAGRSYAPTCFVARDTRAGFAVHSELHEVMRGNIVVRKSPKDTVVVDTQPNSGARSAFGILRYARTFLVPI